MQGSGGSLYASTGIDPMQSFYDGFLWRLKEKDKNEKVIVSAIIRKLVHPIYANNDRSRFVLRRV